MNLKMAVLVILIATSSIVWYVLSMSSKSGTTTGTEQSIETVDSVLVGNVTSVTGFRVKFKVGNTDYTTRVSPSTQIVKSQNLSGKVSSAPGAITDLSAGSRVKVYYKVDRNRGLNEPLIEFNADKIEIILPNK